MTPTQTPTGYGTAHEAGHILGVTVQSVAAIAIGRCEVIRTTGGHLRYRLDDIRAIARLRSADTKAVTR
jgi:hypothetical protein